MERKQALDKLIDKYLSGQANAEERAQLERAYQQAAKRQTLNDLGELDMKAFDKIGRQSWMDLMARIGETPVRRIFPWKKWAAFAAAVSIFLVIGWLLLDMRYETRDMRLADTDILPGGNRATLTLADGRVVELSAAQSGIIIGDGRVTYIDGSFVTEARDKNHRVRIPAEESRDGHVGSLGSGFLPLASITTPEGGTYSITLPDGSKVWLNAASTLKYPSRFDGQERIVELEGEAYFEIVSLPSMRGGGTTMRQSQGNEGNTQIAAARTAPHSLPLTRVPFKVITSNQTIEVLGTQFNISAYPDDPETKTTLVEGSVKVSAAGASLQLVPGNQSIVRGAHTEIHNVNIGQFIAWREGWMIFQDKPFAEIMREMSRWYDIEVRYEGAVPQEVGFGMVRRTDNFSTVLKLLESGRIRFRMEGNTLVILDKE